MFYLSGFHPDIAQTVRRYLMRFSKEITVCDDSIFPNFNTQDILIIDSDTQANPAATAPSQVIIIGTRPSPFDSVSRTKHFKKPVLLSQIGATIVQWNMPDPDNSLPLCDGWELLMPRKILVHKESGRSIPLTDKEGDLLSLLLQASPDALEKDALLQKIWGYDERVDTHTLETHIYRLRTKLCDVLSDGKGLITYPDGYGFTR